MFLVIIAVLATGEYAWLLAGNTIAISIQHCCAVPPGQRSVYPGPAVWLVRNSGETAGV